MAKKNVNISGGEAEIQKIIALREPGKGEKMLVKNLILPLTLLIDLFHI